ncbi:tRNA (N6-threonylcarbamoyladenosine(37)-N6)-methyltransferase TrmO [Streptomyces spiroverticillatus]|uniref:tRNA (N6-threonylcarbamoyladenosine(37)-N6)-methyltransferase TrmO n=1 Tax=Streptomyces finlayi TaxID=67296 RepID=A0A918X816_9ACTN|nr:tRNA (N6-threonylcarbamoyladenosine(37)-N6)-methyltransferase TrmO [Streptomyces spiroverticillatus]GHD17528.1 tRNA (N6-threonylcarbamoyladenosine(37)-N6)-methyltransferase TrmO [Streptomyces finlayi]
MQHAFAPIGTVRGSRQESVQDNWGDTECRIELDPAELDADATLGLSDYSHVEVVFAFDRTDRSCRGAQHPRGNPSWPRVGILAQRAPNRPNHIGVTVCALVAVDGRTLTVRGLDALDGSPVLDIKPYLPEFAPRGEVRVPQWSVELMRHYF